MLCFTQLKVYWHGQALKPDEFTMKENAVHQIHISLCVSLRSFSVYGAINTGLEAKTQKLYYSITFKKDKEKASI